MVGAEETISDMGTKLASGAGTIANVFMWILIIGGIVGLVWLLMYVLSFKIKVEVREVINGRIVKGKDKARIKKEKNGLFAFQLLRGKRKLEVPGPKCFDIDKKGKKSIVMYYVAEDDAWIAGYDGFNYEDYKGERAKLSEKDVKDNSKLKGELKTVEPFTSTQRIQLLHEFKEAESYKKKKLGEQLLALAPYFILVLILAVFMIFFEQVVQPFSDYGDKMVILADKMEQSMEHMENIALEKQKLSGEIIVSNNVTKPIPN